MSLTGTIRGNRPANGLGGNDPAKHQNFLARQTHRQPVRLSSIRATSLWSLPEIAPVVRA
jgi:hypothetical protein